MEPTEPVAHEELVDRRRVLRHATMAGAALGAAAYAMRPGSAAASTGNLVYGTSNNAGSDWTTLESDAPGYTLRVENLGTGTALDVYAADAPQALNVTNGDGTAVRAVAYGSGYGVLAVGTDDAYAINGYCDGTGTAVWAEIANSGTGRAVLATIANSSNTWPSIEASTQGLGPAALAHIDNAASASPAVRGRTDGTGAGVYGESDQGRGMLCRGGAAAIRLMPSKSATHPATGLRGDLLVDSSGRLWFCRGGANWKQVV